MKDLVGQWIWVEKYRPKTLDEMVIDSNLKAQLQKWIDEGQIPNLLFIGHKGTGKTSLTKILINSLPCEWKKINASEQRGIDTIRNEVRQFAMFWTDKPLKIIWCEEADYLTLSAQASLRIVMEEFLDKVRFILTANYNKIIPEIADSRCVKIQFTALDRGAFRGKLAEVLDKEGVDYSSAAVDKVVTISYPDLRKAINCLQYATRDQCLIPEIIEKGDEITSTVVSYIEQGDYSSLYEWLQMETIDFYTIYEELFKYYVRQKEGKYAIYFSEAMRWHDHCANPVVNLAHACFQVIRQKFGRVK